VSIYERIQSSEKGPLTNIFGHMKEEETKRWRKLHNEKRHNLYSSLDITMMTKSRWMRWQEHAIRMKNIRNEYKILVVEHEWKGLLGRSGKR
jgi:hypothetical protein